MKEKKIVQYIVSWLKEYIKKSSFKGFVIGISGGIDSSVTSLLVAMTNFPTLILEMPILKGDNHLSEKHAKSIISKYSNVSYLRKNLYNIFYSFYQTLFIKKNYHHENQKKKEEIKNLAFANIKSRIRMITLYYYANINNYLVVGTGNQVEDFGVGFFTKYGDGGVDLQPISNLNKSEIRSLAKELNIIHEIQMAPPNDGLWEDGRTDEDQLGVTYEELEWAMKMINLMKIEKRKMNSFSKKEKKILKIYFKFHSKNKHKINPIPFCKIPDSLKQKEKK